MQRIHLQILEPKTIHSIFALFKSEDTVTIEAGSRHMYLSSMVAANIIYVSTKVFSHGRIIGNAFWETRSAGTDEWVRKESDSTSVINTCFDTKTLMSAMDKVLKSKKAESYLSLCIGEDTTELIITNPQKSHSFRATLRAVTGTPREDMEDDMSSISYDGWYDKVDVEDLLSTLDNHISGKKTPTLTLTTCSLPSTTQTLLKINSSSELEQYEDTLCLSGTFRPYQGVFCNFVVEELKKILKLAVILKEREHHHHQPLRLTMSPRLPLHITHGDKNIQIQWYAASQIDVEEGADE